MTKKDYSSISEEYAKVKRMMVEGTGYNPGGLEEDKDYYYDQASTKLAAAMRYLDQYDFENARKMAQFAVEAMDGYENGAPDDGYGDGYDGVDLEKKLDKQEYFTDR